MKNLRHDKSGIVLAISLLVLIITITLSAVYISRAVHEKAMAERELRAAKALYTSEAGGQAGLAMLDTIINTDLLNTVNATSATTVSAQAANYVSTNNAIGFLIAYAKNGATAMFTASGSEGVYTGSATALDGSSYTYSIRITAKGNPVTVASNIWDFPYYFRIQTTGTNGSQAKKFTVNGDFTVRVQKDNFARYALFTNNQTLPNGTNVWFTNTTNFSGPMFTNGRYNFAYNPSGTFYDAVKQEDSMARFYNNNSPVSVNASSNGTIDVPIFKSTFTRSAAAISMPTTSSEATMSAAATAGNTYGSNGIYLPASGSTLTGGIYVKGDATVALSVDASDRAVYTITQGATTKTITVNRTTNQTSVTTSSGTTTYTGKPDGTSGSGTILFVNGNISSLSGTVQKDTQMTIATHNDVVIQNNIKYAQYTASSGTVGTAGYVAPSAEGYTNLLGIMSWTGDVRIGTSAPNNVEIHATVMTQSGVFTVDNYDTTSVRGTGTVMGGVISDYYGGFGTFNSATGLSVSGYGRNFVYDTRMDTQYTPPYFPTINTFIAFTNDINDKKFWQPGGF